MKVLKKSKTLSGINIQIEDWSENYPGIHNCGDIIAAYPPKIENAKEKFRLELRFKNGEEATKALKLLESGERKLTDYRAELANEYHESAKIYMEYRAS